MLVRLMYASHLAAGSPCDVIHTHVVQSIMQQSHANNPRLGITGVLCHSDKAFMQVIEGGRENINTLYAKIMADARHTDVMLLHYEEVTERKYAGWTMGHVNLTKVNPSILLRFSELPGLDPHAMSGPNSMALIDDLIAAAAVIGRS